MAVPKDKWEKLEALKIWCDEFVDYLIEKEPSSLFLKGIKLPIDKSFEKGDLKSLEMIRGELNGFLSDFPIEEREAIERKLYEKSGISAIDRAKEVERLILKGRLSSDDEFRMLGEYIDELLANGRENGAAKIDVMNTMRRRYELEKQK